MVPFVRAGVSSSDWRVRNGAVMAMSAIAKSAAANDTDDEDVPAVALEVSFLRHLTAFICLWLH